jgi:FkbM family methyltransferase
MIDRLYRFARAFKNYDHPLQLAFQRRFSKDLLYVKDRRTHLAFRCRRRADQMFGETFHLRIYDVPLAPLRKGDIVIDVGANHGFFSCYAAFEGAIVHAFEPQPETFELLEANVEANGLSDRIHTYAAAVGATEGPIELSITNQLGGGMSSTNPGFVSRTGLNVVDSVSVPSRSIDRVVDAIPEERIRLLKLDCEGAEFEILSALKPEHLERIDAIALEHHPGYPLPDLITQVLSWGSHQLSAANTKPFGVGNAMLYLVHNAAIKEHFRCPAPQHVNSDA